MLSANQQFVESKKIVFRNTENRQISGHISFSILFNTGLAPNLGFKGKRIFIDLRTIVFSKLGHPLFSRKVGRNTKIGYRILLVSLNLLIFIWVKNYHFMHKNIYFQYSFSNIPPGVMRARLADPSTNEADLETDDKAAASHSNMPISARAVS